jgi:hypothetical protein
MSLALQTGGTAENRAKFETTYTEHIRQDSGRQELAYSYIPLNTETHESSEKEDMIIFKKFKSWKGL